MEHIGNQGKMKKKILPPHPHLPPPKTYKEKARHTLMACLGLPIGCMKFLFPKEFITIFGPGYYVLQRTHYLSSLDPIFEIIIKYFDKFQYQLTPVFAWKWFGTYTLSVNPIVKFIYTLCKCKNKYIYIILFSPIKQCKWKYIYIYMILHGNVKQYKYRIV
jgi:hypothetical protein